MLKTFKSKKFIECYKTSDFDWDFHIDSIQYGIDKDLNLYHRVILSCGGVYFWLKYTPKDNMALELKMMHDEFKQIFKLKMFT